MIKKALLYATPMLMAGTMAFGPAHAEGTAAAPAAHNQAMSAEDGPDMEDARDAQETVADAAKVLQQMQADPDLKQMMSEAHGLFVVPHYARGGLVAGGSGGEGIMIQRGTNGWSDPLFYNVGGVSLGAQAGFEAGAVAFLLMNEESVASFAQENNFSLNAEAGLTIVDYSATGQASAGKGDVIMWSDTEGVFAGAQISVSDINWDGEENAAYYGSEVTAASVLGGKAKNTHGNPMADTMTQ
jgi:lipid-binding SYLF domain-containing protein